MKKVITLLLAFVLVFSVFVVGCKNDDSTWYYNECAYEDGKTSSTINESLFYRNQYDYNESAVGADPAVIRITDTEDPNYGKFVMTVTTGAFSISAYISDDLVNWEQLGTIMTADDDGTGEKAYVLFQDIWASEMVYDETDGKYYLYFSAIPKNNPSITGYVNNNAQNTTNTYFGYTYFHIPFVAVSDSYAGPFELVDHYDTYKYADGTAMMDDSGKVVEKAASAPIEHAEIKDNAQGYAYFLRYSTFDPYSIWEAVKNSSDPYVREIVDYEPIPLMRTLDFHPFTAENGDRYLYFVCGKDGRYSSINDIFIMGIKMNTWTEPDYSSISRLTRYGYYEMDDYEDLNAEKSPMESTDAQVNEAPWMTERNGKYYLTYSVNRFSTRAYKVVQAVADSPLGPYRKLTPEEGGTLIGSDDVDDISGPGHHAIVDVAGEYYIVYHSHVDPLLGGSHRYPSMNKIEWITIKDKFGNDLDVMYTNGPSNTTVQPLPSFASGYENVAYKATVSATNLLSSSKASYLTDGYFDIYTGQNMPFMNTYVRSAEFKGETTITMTFTEAQTVRAIMIYNSVWIENAFYDVESIEFESVADGKTTTKTIKNLAFDWKANSSNMMSMRTLGSAIAEFDEISVNKIKIVVKPATVEQIILHDKYADAVLSINEIVVLGKVK